MRLSLPRIFRFSIEGRIFAGFLPGFAVLCFLAFTGYNSFNLFFEKFDKLEQSGEENIRFLEIKQNIASLQRQVTVYAYVGFNGILRKVERLQLSVEKKFDEATAPAKRDPDAFRRFEALRRHYSLYKESFAAVAEKRRALETLKNINIRQSSGESHAILDRLKERADAAGDEATSVLLTEIQNALYRTDVNVTTFGFEPHAALLKNIRSSFGDLRDRIRGLLSVGSLVSSKEEITRLGELLEQYDISVAEFAVTNRVYLHLTNVVLAGQAAEMERLASELDALSRRRVEAFREAIITDTYEQQLHQITLSLIAAFTGLLCVWLCAGGIAAPVTRMAEALSGLAAGKSDTVIPGQDRKDEIGQMAQAAEEFKMMGARIQAQSAVIKDSETKLSAILDNVADGLITATAGGEIITYNNACEHMFGYKAEEAIGGPISSVLPAHNRDAAMPEHENTTEGMRKNGARFPAELAVSALYVEEKQLYSYVIRDITERVEAETALRNANAELEEFAYRTSHDLRSPLVSSIRMLEIAQTALGSGNAEKSSETVDRAWKSLKRLETLVTDILDLSKAKNLEETPREIDIAGLIDETVAKFSYMDGFENIEIIKEINISKPFYTLKTRLTLIIENLFSNAVKYRSTERENSYIIIRAGDENASLLFEIVDNGIGIPEQYRHELFRMFKRFHPRTAYGSGLGLYMIKKSVTVLGGNISYVPSEEETLFRVNIPASTIANVTDKRACA